MRPRTPIDAMIDRLDLKCVRCKVSQSVGCDCFEPITLRCPDCGRTKQDFRRPGDVIVEGAVELRCPECWDKET